MVVHIHPGAIADEGAQLGDGTRVRHCVHVGRGMAAGGHAFIGERYRLDGKTLAPCAAST